MMFADFIVCTYPRPKYEGNLTGHLPSSLILSLLFLSCSFICVRMPLQRSMYVQLCFLNIMFMFWFIYINVKWLYFGLTGVKLILVFYSWEFCRVYVKQTPFETPHELLTPVNCCLAAGKESTHFPIYLACEVCQWFLWVSRLKDCNLWPPGDCRGPRGPLLCCLAIMWVSAGCRLCLIRAPHWPFLFSFLICVLLSSILTSSISQSICLHTSFSLHCLPPASSHLFPPHVFFVCMYFSPYPCLAMFISLYPFLFIPSKLIV